MPASRSRTFRTLIAARAWNTLSVVPSDLFGEVQQELEALAREAARTPEQAVQGSRPLSGRTHALLYAVDPDARTVTLEALVRLGRVAGTKVSSSRA